MKLSQNKSPGVGTLPDPSISVPKSHWHSQRPNSAIPNRSPHPRRRRSSQSSPRRFPRADEMGSADLVLKPSCEGCGNTSDLYGTGCKHTTLCSDCGKSMARSRARCLVCSLPITRLIRVRIRSSAPLFPARACGCRDRRSVARPLPFRA